MNSQNSAEREKAVFALRFMNVETAAPLLIHAYQDQALNVKQASVRAIQYQDSLKPYASLIRVCSGEKNRDCLALAERLKEN
jgi:hypothetical protein